MQLDSRLVGLRDNTFLGRMLVRLGLRYRVSLGNRHSAVYIRIMFSILCSITWRQIYVYDIYA